MVTMYIHILDMCLFCKRAQQKRLYSAKETYNFKEPANGKYVYTHSRYVYTYGVATISRLLKIIGLFCKRALYKRLYFAKETYNFKETTNRGHPILECMYRYKLYQYAVTHCNALQHTATPCNTLQHYVYTYRNVCIGVYILYHYELYRHAVTHCNALQHTATHCNTLQHSATLCIYIPECMYRYVYTVSL